MVKVNIDRIVNIIKTETDQDLTKIYNEFINNLNQTILNIDNYYNNCSEDVRLKAYLEKGNNHIEDLDTLCNNLYEKAIGRIKCVEVDLQEGETLDEKAIIDEIFNRIQNGPLNDAAQNIIKEFNDRVLLVESMGRKC